MSSQFKYLFSPIKIGKKTARNRIVMPAHYMLYGSGLSGRDPYSLSADRDDDRYVAYLEEKAKGGAAVVITRTCQVGPENIGWFDYVAPSSKRLGEACRKIAQACQKHGALALLQLGSYGKEQGDYVGAYPRPSWSFSPVPSPTCMEMPHVLEIDEIERHIAEYVASARVAEEAGMDGVELHTSEGSLLQQSLTPMDNQRSDKYGEQLAFITAIINGIRAECGSDMVLSIRFAADDMWPTEMGGLGNAGLADVARRLDQTGKVDMIVTAHGKGLHDIYMNIQPLYMPLGVWLPQDAQIKKAVKNIVVVGNGRIKDPVQAEQALADGLVDMVGMVRAQIADPHWARKASEGRVDDIRPCIGCNQGCVERIAKSHAGTCLQNPSTGWESRLGGTIEPGLDRAQEKKKVLVIGGGPAGMEAARVAAERGHSVTLYEKQKELGGQVNIITRVAARNEFADVVRWRNYQLRKLGVTIKLGTEATASQVVAENADVVIVATGSLPWAPRIPGGEQDNVLSCQDVLLGTKPVGQSVAIFDMQWRHKASTVAEYLAEQGKSVQIITPTPVLGVFDSVTHRPLVTPKLLSMGVVITTNTQPVQISGKSVTVTNVHTHEPRQIAGIDTFVVAAYNQADDALYKDLKGKVKRLELIGDAWGPRTVMHAINDAFFLAREL